MDTRITQELIAETDFRTWKKKVNDALVTWGMTIVPNTIVIGNGYFAAVIQGEVEEEPE